MLPQAGPEPLDLLHDVRAELQVAFRALRLHLADLCRSTRCPGGHVRTVPVGAERSTAVLALPTAPRVQFTLLLDGGVPAASRPYGALTDWARSRTARPTR